MKRCPKCNRTYNDDTLRFCLDDGVPLADASDARPHGRDSDPPPTAVMHEPAPTMKSSGPTIPSYTGPPDVYSPPPREARQSNPILTAGVVAIALLLLALVGIAAYFVLRQPSGNEAAQTNRGSSPTVREASSPAKGQKNDPAPTDTRSADEMITPEPRAATPLKITVSASSQRLAVQSNTYYPANAIDGRRSTAWIEGADGPGIGEWIRFDFDREIVLHRILIQPGYFKSPQIWAENNRLAAVTAYFSDGSSRELTFADRMESQKADIGAIRTRWVRFVIKSVYHGANPGSTDDTALSEVAFEWEP
ncbi:MAG TPA: discoidin domain-containing protein [Pyrinomonadaceae bacterium]|nr:discoidin domain-containing protein [Pyrinomonadaceae bacterium]